MKIYNITPVPKPRQTQRDKWLNPPRPCVAKYRHFCDLVNGLWVDLPESGAKIMFVLPMPKSWSNQKKHEMYREPHQQKPDLSNLLKALEDALYKDDSHIWNYSGLSKTWGKEGQIWIGNENS